MMLKQVIFQKIKNLQKELSLSLMTLLLMSMVIFGLVYANILNASSVQDKVSFEIPDFEKMQTANANDIAMDNNIANNDYQISDESTIIKNKIIGVQEDIYFVNDSKFNDDSAVFLAKNQKSNSDKNSKYEINPSDQKSYDATRKASEKSLNKDNQISNLNSNVTLAALKSNDLNSQTLLLASASDTGISINTTNSLSTNNSTSLNSHQHSSNKKVMSTSTTNENIANKNSQNNKTDSEYPINIESDSAEFDDQNGTAIYKGNVVAIQGSRHLFSDSLYIYRGKDNQIEKIIAKGNPANIKAQPNPEKPEGFGYAKTIKYYPNEDKAELIEEAKLEQNGDIITGQFLTYFFEKGLLVSHPIKKARTTVTLKPRDSSKDKDSGKNKK